MVVLVILGIVAAFALPRLQEAREIEAARACRERLAVLGRAMASYGNRNGGRLPGYMNLLKVDRATPYVDPVTKEPAPVSWAVEILPDLERADLYADWKGAPGSSATTTGTDVYLEALVCPADSSARTTGAFLSYVANTGMPDLPTSIPAKAADAKKPASRGMPRDWQANGVFFDNFSDDPLVKPLNTTRGPMVYMQMELVRDPKERTILLTENIDATSYRLAPNGDGENRFSQAEAAVGATYAIGSVTGDSNETLAMAPARPSLKINAEVGRGDGRSMDYCRPSSNHPGGVNVVYVDQNAKFLSESISYHVLARMMSSEDFQMKYPGTAERVLQNYRGFGPIDIEINP